MIIAITPTMLGVSLDGLNDEAKLYLEKYVYPVGVVGFYGEPNDYFIFKGSPDKLYKVLLDLSYTFDIEIV